MTTPEDALRDAGADVVTLSPGRTHQSGAKGFDEAGSEASDQGATRAANSARSGFNIWDAGDDDAPIPPRPWLLGKSFCRRFLSSIIGTGGTGKTSLRILQALALATERPLTGEHVFRRSRVLLISLEDDRDELRRRLRAACSHHNIQPADIEGWLYCAAPKGLKLTATSGNFITKGPLFDLLREQVRQRDIDLVIIDPFVKAHDVDENDNGAIDRVVSMLAELAIELNVAIDLPHHMNKGPADPGNAEKGRGASAFKDGGRLVYTLSEMSGEEAKMLGIAADERRSLVRLDSAKVNLAPKGNVANWFRLVSVSLNNGTKDYPAGDHVQAIEPWTPPDLWREIPSHVAKQILGHIDKGMPDGRRYSRAGQAKDRAAWLVVQQYVPALTEAQCRKAIRTWFDTEVLVDVDYHSPTRRNPEKGLSVNDTKKPS